MPDPATVPPPRRFERCLTEVLRHEGGYSDHPADPGGATNRGITRKTLARWRGISPWWRLPRRDVKALSGTETSQIYRALFWRPSAAPVMPGGLDLALFDYAVNSGPVRAVKALQDQLGVRRDGLFGPVSARALRAKTSAMGTAGLINALCDQRLGFLMRLSTFAVFGRGWRKRLKAVRAAALADVPKTQASFPKPRSPSMDILSGYKTYIVAFAMLVAAIGQILGVDIPAFDGQSPGQLLMEALAILFLRRGITTSVENA